jgi:hypothetical protein
MTVECFFFEWFTVEMLVQPVVETLPSFVVPWLRFAAWRA